MYDGEPESPTMSRAAVVICTRNRASDVSTACEAVFRDQTVRTLIIVDASTNDDTQSLVARFSSREPSVDIHYKRARRPGLTKQRNEAAEFCHDLGVEVIHFIDDDTEVFPGYFTALEARFLANPALAGLGAVVENQPRIPIRWLKRLFLLWGPRHGSILRSGRVVMGQYPNATRDGCAPDWIHGCAMSYRTDIVLKYRFDEELEGYSLGEDQDFGFRVSRHYSLGVEPSARCVHRVTRNGLSPETYAYLNTVVLYAWVRQHRRDGMSLAAFWWSAVGDLLLHSIDGVLVPRRGGGRKAKGMIRGFLVITKGQATKSVKP